MNVEHLSVIKIRNIIMATVPPDPDDETVAALQEKILLAMDKYQAKGLVLDISTVDTVDSYFARVIAETALMIGLMGGRTVIAGMRPSVAITTTQLGLTLGNALTAIDVDRALLMLDEN
ncbi:MAG: STAS domain-containing protein [Candidatus Odinarchaeota archaeon]